ncbi:hypothetical protein SRABI96_02021 [Peribacillus sp. Bi96]|nr:hypothetical protein SRABI96_02021 [Peribacillus sp. Bi96]
MEVINTFPFGDIILGRFYDGKDNGHDEYDFPIRKIRPGFFMFKGKSDVQIIKTM